MTNITCFVTNRESKPVTSTVLHFDQSGEYTESTERQSNIVCYNQEIVQTSNTWIPYFNEFFISDQNITTEFNGVITITVVKFGNDGDVVHPFGDNTPDIELPAEFSFNFIDDEGHSGEILCKNKELVVDSNVVYPIVLTATIFA